ncbi:TonB-dependent receptor [Bacteroides xylanisolvens]|uniref:SusC/RagA family TonB-linked outer membrane protein n=1 Tax=Bacteroides xylanisolvens TaxID=371601 RepID=UPI001CDD3D1B|nr:TonB-dependent receptor [Bacteroides xylanisolvens]MCA4599130.1 TonB-dependent receptor [Bacteroides xylanisolvens]MCA4613101.1 TonB-dependent receptor [Bacteroides xylanisolvens]MCA4640356.1 TonB-dependent receptor [Bacteroides xylanisolvens]MCA4645111.1 TonB-dependent receptor [Bacteroides xylanisolvens]
MKTCFLSRWLLILLFFIFVPVLLYAQTAKVTGLVQDSEGFPLIGVNVLVKGTTNGGITDFDGNFILSSVSKGAVLVFSYVGYDSKEVIYKGESKLHVVLESSSLLLNEVVAIGYEVKKKSVVTGAISSLNSDELLKARPANAVNALNGRVSGVNVVTNSGQPGSAPKLVIRGVGTNGNSNPLYVIDGLPMDDMNSLNPNDIESMEILKDATSAAIYGARASNGVVLITTKKGKKGKTSLSYDGYYGFSSVQKVPDMCNAEEYMMLMKEFAANDKAEVGNGIHVEPTGHDTDWFDEIFNTAPVTEHNLTATFGSDKGSSLISLNYLNQEGIIGESKSFFKRYTARFNGSYTINKHITVGGNINYTYRDRSGINTGTNGWNPIQYAYNIDPTTPVYDENSGDNLGYGVANTGYGRMWNPLAFMEQSSTGKNVTQHIFGNTYAEVTLLKDLVIRTDFGINHKNIRTRSYSPSYYHDVQNSSDKTTVNQGSNSNSSWQWENILRYKKQFANHNLSILLGTSASEDLYETLSGSRNNLPSEAIGNEWYWYLDAGDVMTATNKGSANPRHSMFSYFGRLSYNFAERYMAEVVVRRDGSSNFGPSNKYATFPGFSLGWNVSNEKFWNVKNFDSLKLRFSWGQNGNERISAFSYTSIIGNKYNYTFGASPTIYVGSAPNSLLNPDVHWETSEQFNVGADMTFFGGMLRGSIDWFKKDTKDLLFQPTLESIRGNDSAYKNMGKISNKGLEMQFTFRKQIGEVALNVSANASYLKNKVVNIGNANGYLDGGLWRETTNVTRMQEGYAMGYFRLYKVLGIFQTPEEVQNYKNDKGVVIQPNAVPGDFIWQDTDGNGVIEEADRIDCGNPWPKWTYGLNLGAEWRGFDFNMFLTGKAGFHVYASWFRSEGYGRANLPTFYLDRWTKEGDNKGVPRLSIKDPNENFIKPSTFFLYDASFLKIGSIELGYSFPQKWIEKVLLTKARVYVTVDNVATFTSYPFMDPEIGDMRGSGNNVLENGMDYGTYPQARTFRFGVSLAF